MGAMQCNRFLDQFESWMEGEQSAEALAHVRECAHCRALVDDMNAIKQSAHAWTGEEADPPERVWTSLRAQLEAEGIIHDASAGRELQRAEDNSGWFQMIFGLVPRPVLAGAYLAALIGISI